MLPALATESIVGHWRVSDGLCTPADGTVAIGPLSLTQDEVSCSFASVKRSGSVVTWTGRCEATVIARYHDGVLAIIRNGVPDEEAYIRCE